MKKKNLSLICFNLKVKTLLALLFVFCLTNIHLYATIKKNAGHAVDFKIEKTNKTFKENRNAISGELVVPIIELGEISDTCGTAEISPTFIIENCSDPGVTTYEWDFSGAQTPSSTDESPIDIAYNTAGEYTVRLTVTNDCGTSVEASRTFTIFAALEATLTASTTQTVCEEENVTLSVAIANSQGNISYQWFEVTDNTTNALAETTAIFTAPTGTAGTKAYYATVTDDQGPCAIVTTESVSVVVNQQPVIANALETVISYSGTPFTYDPTTNANNTIPAETQYTWTINNPGNITGISAITSPENIISQILTLSLIHI